MATSGQMNEEQKIESVKRSKLYADILGIVSKLKLADSGGADAYDIPSISYELELYFLNESPLVDHPKEVYIPCEEETDLNIVEHKNGESYGEFVCHVKKATTPIVQGYSEDTLRAAISAGLSIGYSPNYKLENREQEIQNILSSLPQSTSITK